MRPWFALALFLTFVSLLAGMRVLGAPDIRVTLAILDPGGCPSGTHCWHRLIIGQTAYPRVVDILRADPFIDESSIRKSVVDSFSYFSPHVEQVCFNTRSVPSWEGCALSGSATDEPIKSLTWKPPWNTLRLGEVINLLGLPVDRPYICWNLAGLAPNTAMIAHLRFSGQPIHYNGTIAVKAYIPGLSTESQALDPAMQVSSIAFWPEPVPQDIDYSFWRGFGIYMQDCGFD